MKILHPILLAALASVLSGCASRTEREALRQCAFAPASTRILSRGADSLVVALAVEIRNPGPQTAVLDSFQAVAATDRPLARFSHGALRRIASGKTDTVDLRLAMATKDLLPLAFTFMMSPPDSIGLEGSAWIPNLWGLWTSEQRFSTRVPYKNLAAQMKGLFPKAGGLPGLGAP